MFTGDLIKFQINIPHTSASCHSITRLSDAAPVLVWAHHRSWPWSCRQTNYFRDGTKWGTSCQINPISCSVTKVWSDMGKAAHPNFMDPNAAPPRQHSGKFNIFASHVWNIFMWKIVAIIFGSQEIVRILGCGRRACSNCFPFFLDLSNYKNQQPPKLFPKLERSVCLSRSKQANIFQRSRNPPADKYLSILSWMTWQGQNGHNQHSGAARGFVPLKAHCDLSFDRSESQKTL